MARIRESIYLSPCARSENFSELTGNSVYLKLDNLQRTGAFKERGALNKLLTLTPEERSRGVIAASAGNHAQGVAYHAGKHGVRAQIVMPLTTPLTRCRVLGCSGAPKRSAFIIAIGRAPMVKTSRMMPPTPVAAPW